ncbi:hypothetical protein MANI_110388 [Metarhizium anisopliae]|nr:hypothetical protein MANI_110388 [Metarhizium anisopliae]
MLSWHAAVKKVHLVTPICLTSTAMAMATSSPPCEPDPFDLGIYTPKNLARGAHAALLRDSSPVEITDIGVSPVRFVAALRHSLGYAMLLLRKDSSSTNSLPCPVRSYMNVSRP